MAKFFDVLNCKTEKLDKVRAYFGQGRYTASLSLRSINIMDNRKNKNVDIELNSMRELLEFGQQMLDSQIPRLEKKPRLLPVLGKLNNVSKTFAHNTLKVL